MQISPIIKYKYFELNTSTKALSINWNVIDLTPKEFAIIKYLLHNQVRVVSNEVEIKIQDNCKDCISKDIIDENLESVFYSWHLID